MKKRLKRNKQCSKCPWKVSTNPRDIPNGYCENKHKALEKTIAKDLSFSGDLSVMACHETHDAYCVGWLFNQIGEGNNLNLRMIMLDYDLSHMKTIGPQHQRFEDTLPKE